MINSFEIVVVFGNKVECCFNKVACCCDIVAGVDGALQSITWTVSCCASFIDFSRCQYIKSNKRML